MCAQEMRCWNERAGRVDARPTPRRPLRRRPPGAAPAPAPAPGARPGARSRPGARPGARAPPPADPTDFLSGDVHTQYSDGHLWVYTDRALTGMLIMGLRQGDVSGVTGVSTLGDEEFVAEKSTYKIAVTFANPNPVPDKAWLLFATVSAMPMYAGADPKGIEGHQLVWNGSRMEPFPFASDSAVSVRDYFNGKDGSSDIRDDTFYAALTIDDSGDAEVLQEVTLTAKSGEKTSWGAANELNHFNMWGKDVEGGEIQIKINVKEISGDAVLFVKMFGAGMSFKGMETVSITDTGELSFTYPNKIGTDGIETVQAGVMLIANLDETAADAFVTYDRLTAKHTHLRTKMFYNSETFNSDLRTDPRVSIDEDHKHIREYTVAGIDGNVPWPPYGPNELTIYDEYTQAGDDLTVTVSLSELTGEVVFVSKAFAANGDFVSEMFLKETISAVGEDLTFTFTNVVGEWVAKQQVGIMLVTGASATITALETTGPAPAPAPSVPDAAPPPPIDVADFLSIWSSEYGNREGTDWNPNWGQSTQVEAGEVLMYTNLNYQGTQFGQAVDASAYSKMSLSYFTEQEEGFVKFILISKPGEPDMVEAVSFFEIHPSQAGMWVNTTFDLSELVSQQGLDLAHIGQLKVEGDPPGLNIAFDHIFFHNGVPGDSSPSA